MIELNLLPDVKLEYLKAERARRLALLISFLVSVGAVVLLVLMFGAESYQKHTLGNLNATITSQAAKLKNEPRINNILTVQNQLNSINHLHDKKPTTTRLFDYLNQLTPTGVTISDFSINFGTNKIIISGKASSLSDVNQYVDTYKFTNYSLGKKNDQKPAFSNVVLAQFNSSTAIDGTTNVTYSITMTYMPALFDITKNVSLVIPNIITTRSQQENPGPLFIKDSTQSSTNAGAGGQ